MSSLRSEKGNVRIQKVAKKTGNVVLVGYIGGIDYE